MDKKRTNEQTKSGWITKQLNQLENAWADEGGRSCQQIFKSSSF